MSLARRENDVKFATTPSPVIGTSNSCNSFLWFNAEVI